MKVLEYWRLTGAGDHTFLPGMCSTQQIKVEFRLCYGFGWDMRFCVGWDMMYCVGWDMMFCVGWDMRFCVGWDMMYCVAGT